MERKVSCKSEGTSVDPVTGVGDASGWLDEFCALGVHRVASEVDRRTLEWFADTLSGLGASAIEKRPFGVARYVASSRVVIDGDEVDSDTLYYEGTGSVRSDTPHVTA